jgi:hypothetical protein
MVVSSGDLISSHLKADPVDRKDETDLYLPIDFGERNQSQWKEDSGALGLTFGRPRDFGFGFSSTITLEIRN